MSSAEFTSAWTDTSVSALGFSILPPGRFELFALIAAYTSASVAPDPISRRGSASTSNSRTAAPLSCTVSTFGMCRMSEITRSFNTSASAAAVSVFESTAYVNTGASAPFFCTTGGSKSVGM